MEELMLIRRSIEHKVNMGNYEHVLVSATIETEAAIPLDEINARLEEAVAADLAKAAKHTADEDSYIKEWIQE
jgi:hypothetical protein